MAVFFFRGLQHFLFVKRFILAYKYVTQLKYIEETGINVSRCGTSFVTFCDRKWGFVHTDRQSLYSMGPVCQWWIGRRMGEWKNANDKIRMEKCRCREVEVRVNVSVWPFCRDIKSARCIKVAVSGDSTVNHINKTQRTTFLLADGVAFLGVELAFAELLCFLSLSCKTMADHIHRLFSKICVRSQSSLRIHSYFDNVMTKFIVNNRTDA